MKAKIFHTVILNVLLTAFFSSFCRPIVENEFELTLSTFNHAQGSWWNVKEYSVKGNRLQVIRHGLGDEKENLYSIKLSNKTLEKLRSIHLENLKDIYNNSCVMLTSGDEYFIHSKNNGQEKKIHLHHYYLAEIEQITSELDRHLPKKYKVNYLDKDTEQDCR